MRPVLTGVVVCFLVGPMAFAQAANPRLEFEVASVKPWTPPADGGRGPIMMGMQGGPGTADPSQVRYSGLPLKMVLANAYDVRPFQINGPAWLDMERFDIVAKVPAGATKDQVRIMLQNLLADRFRLKLHHETKDSAVYELVVDKNGPKMKPTTLTTDASADGPPPPPSGPPKLGKDGFPELDRPGLFMMVMMGNNGPRSRMVARAQTTADIGRALSNQVDRPVVDKTGLTGKYDFSLEFSFEPGVGGPMGGLRMTPPGGGLAGPGPGPGPGPGGAGAVGGGPVPAPLDSQNADSAPTIFAAVQSELGLKLDAKRAPLDLLVVDQVEKTPTQN